MMISKQTWWLLGGGAVALGIGTASYFLWIRKKPTADKYGNPIISTGKNGGISGGVLTASGNKGKAVTEPNWNKPFDMNYQKEVAQWIAPNRVVGLDPVVALGMAEALFKAKGVNLWDDDKEAVVQNIFQKRLQDKVQVSALSGAFWHKYKKDLWAYLKEFLSASEMEAYVNKPVRSLTNYTST